MGHKTSDLCGRLIHLLVALSLRGKGNMIDSDHSYGSVCLLFPLFIRDDVTSHDLYNIYHVTFIYSHGGALDRLLA